MDKDSIGKEWLYEQYVVNGLTAKQIADSLNCGKRTVLLRLDDCGIEKRFSYKQKKNKGLLTDKEWLYEQYVTKNLNATQIGKIIKCNRKTVTRCLESFGIPIKNISESMMPGKSKTPLLYDNDWLYEQYVVKKMPILTIKRKVGTSHHSIRIRLEAMGVEIRSAQESINNVSSIHIHQLIPLLNKHKINHISSFIIKENNKFKYEIDEYLPDLKIFLELQGVYWHGYLNRKPKKQTSEHKSD